MMELEKMTKSQIRNTKGWDFPNWAGLGKTTIASSAASFGSWITLLLLMIVLFTITCPCSGSEENPTVDSSSTVADDLPERWDNRRKTLIASLTIFMLAVFVGFEIITKVPPTLHTPLMSGSNAISGITIVGAIIATGTAVNQASWIGCLAVAMASINVVGGFLVTGRMLAMFKK